MERHATEVFAGKGQLPGGKESARWLKTTSLRVFSLLETHGILSPLVGIRMEAAHQEQMFTYLRPSNLFHRATDGDTKNTWRVPASLELLFNLLRNISVKAQRFLQVLPERSVLLPRILHNIEQYNEMYPFGISGLLVRFESLPAPSWGCWQSGCKRGTREN
jgi:hypothetical protein